jgi:hypothetical protein
LFFKSFFPDVFAGLEEVLIRPFNESFVNQQASVLPSIVD